MKRLMLFAGMAVAVVIVAAGGLASQQTSAAPFTFTYDVGLSTTALNSHPDLEVALRIDTQCQIDAPPFGVGCTTTPTNGFFDIAVTQYNKELHSTVPGDLGGPAAVPNIGSKIGSNAFQIDTNQKTALGADNVSTVTGAPPACGAPPTTIQLALGQPFAIIQATTSAGILVPGTDTNASGLPDTQDDANSNGILDGADKMPSYINTLFGSNITLLVARGFGVAEIIAGVAQTDVNFLTLNLNAADATLGYASVTTLGNTDTSYDPAGSQSSLTCTPFISRTMTFGTAVDGPGTTTTPGNLTCLPACAGAGKFTRTILAGAPGGVIHYAFGLSSSEDADNDGVAPGLDRCPTNAASGTLDTDGDGLGDSCDPFPFSVNNNGDGFSGPYPTKQTVTLVGQVGDTLGRAVWDPDQDIDGDGVHNFSDNCPTVPNRDQKDNDADGVGNACDQNPLSAHAGGPCAPVPTAAAPDVPLRNCASSTRDAWSGGAQGLAPGIDFPTGCDAGTTCNYPAHGVVDGIEGTGDKICDDAITVGQPEGNTAGGGTIAGADANPPVCTPYIDSNDDGFADNFAAGFNDTDGAGADPGLAGVTDVNSDSDADGCDDHYEALGFCGGNPLNADTDGNGVIDGAQDWNGNGIPDWRDAAAGIVGGQTASGSSPNGQGSPDSDNDGCTNIQERKGRFPQIGGTVTAASNTTPIIITTASTGTLAVGEGVFVAGVLGNTGANGLFKVFAVTATTITLDLSVGSGAYTSGGTWVTAPFTDITGAGGGRDALNPYDFADVPTPPNSVAGTRDKVVKLADVLAALTYVGTSSGSPNTPNANGVTYGGRAATMAFPGDSNNDGRSNGAEYDRVGGAIAGISKAPNGTVTLSDVLVVLAQVGTNCATSP